MQVTWEPRDIEGPCVARERLLVGVWDSRPVSLLAIVRHHNSGVAGRDCDRWGARMGWAWRLASYPSSRWGITGPSVPASQPSMHSPATRAAARADSRRGARMTPRVVPPVVLPLSSRFSSQAYCFVTSRSIQLACRRAAKRAPEPGFRTSRC